jgi:hypothetical protein
MSVANNLRCAPSYVKGRITRSVQVFNILFDDKITETR